MIKEIKWDYKNINSVQPNYNLLQKLPYLLPVQFIELIKKTNGGDMDYCFEYYDINLKKYIGTGLSCIFGLGLDSYDLLKEYNDPADMFPVNILAFSVTGNGDKICFDYRDDPNTDNPPIVYWNHEAEEGLDVSFVAKDFESFIAMLEEPDPDEMQKIEEIIARSKQKQL